MISPTPPRPVTAAAIETRLRAHISQLMEAIDHARGDRVEDMARLEDEVARLCRDIDALPPGEAAQLGPSVADLIGRMEDLIQELRALQARADKSGGGAA